MQKGIMRIPGYNSQDIRNENPFIDSPEQGIAEVLEGIISHSQDSDHLSNMLDWAMQIRDTEGMTWQESLEIAMILYFG